ncbi:MAG: hypothetical protein ACJAW3_001253 [Lentimonas sp.]|jgi:hypothetical protein
MIERNLPNQEGIDEIQDLMKIFGTKTSHAPKKQDDLTQEVVEPEILDGNRLPQIIENITAVFFKDIENMNEVSIMSLAKLSQSISSKADHDIEFREYFTETAQQQEEVVVKLLKSALQEKKVIVNNKINVSSFNDETFGSVMNVFSQKLLGKKSQSTQLQELTSTSPIPISSPRLISLGRIIPPPSDLSIT